MIRKGKIFQRIANTFNLLHFHFLWEISYTWMLLTILSFNLENCFQFPPSVNEFICNRGNNRFLLNSAPVHVFVTSPQGLINILLISSRKIKMLFQHFRMKMAFKTQIFYFEVNIYESGHTGHIIDKATTFCIILLICSLVCLACNHLTDIVFAKTKREHFIFHCLVCHECIKQRLAIFSHLTTQTLKLT